MWPSKHSSLKSFKNLIKTSYFKPTLSTRIDVKIHPFDPMAFPVPSCDVCHQRFEKSGVREAVARVQWELLGASTYDLEGEVS